MTTNQKRKEIGVFGFVIASFGLFCQAARAGTSASFLRLGADARALGLGSAYTAVVQDANSLYWNPAGLARLGRPEVSATHAALYSDILYDIVSYAHPIKTYAIGVGAFRLNQGELEGRSETKEKTSDFSASDFALNVGFAKRATKSLNVGLTAKWIESKIAQESSRALAFDLGSQISVPGSNFQAGFAVLNLGEKMKFMDRSESLPLTVSGGLSYRGLKFLLISADVKQEMYDSRTIFSLGTEFSIVSWASLRAGYLSHGTSVQTAQGKFETDKIAALSGLGLGLGFKMGPGRLDYAVNPAGEMGQAHRVSLSFEF